MLSIDQRRRPSNILAKLFLKNRFGKTLSDTSMWCREKKIPPLVDMIKIKQLYDQKGKIEKNGEKRQNDEIEKMAKFKKCQNQQKNNNQRKIKKK